MAKKSRIAKGNKIDKLVTKYAERRAQLKETVRNPKTSEDDRETAQLKLQSLPRNSSSVRHRNRCSLTGRSRGYLRKFGLCRIAFREMALQGLIPGVKKASW